MKWAVHDPMKAKDNLQCRMSYGGRKGNRAFHRILRWKRYRLQPRKKDVIDWWKSMRKLAVQYPDRLDIVGEKFRQIMKLS